MRVNGRAIFGRRGSFRPFAIAALAAAIFVADASTHTNISVSVLYVVVVLMTVGSSRERTIVLVSIGCAALTVTALFVAPPGPSFSTAVLNHGLSIAANVTTTILVLRTRSAITERKRAREESLQQAQSDLTPVQPGHADGRDDGFHLA